MAKTRRYGWDACTWIAAIIEEKVEGKGGKIEDRGRLCRHVLDLASKKKVEIATSGLSLAEVCREEQIKKEDGDTLSDFFRNEYILIVPVDRYVGTVGRQLMQSSFGLKPADAVHLATAVVADVAEFHTFDRKLLRLDQQIEMPSGGRLTICKPPAPPKSLFDDFD